MTGSGAAGYSHNELLFLSEISSCHLKLRPERQSDTCRLTFFLDDLPAELVSPDHREHRIKALQRDHLEGLLQMERMETRRRSLNVTHHIHL